MKQGVGKSSDHPKDRFVANKVTPHAAARIGVIESSAPKLYASRKAEAPGCTCTSHKAGSQGRH